MVRLCFVAVSSWGWDSRISFVLIIQGILLASNFYIFLRINGVWKEINQSLTLIINSTISFSFLNQLNSLLPYHWSLRYRARKQSQRSGRAENREADLERISRLKHAEADISSAKRQRSKAEAYWWIICNISIWFAKAIVSLLLPTSPYLLRVTHIFFSFSRETDAYHSLFLILTTLFSFSLFQVCASCRV